MKQVEFPKPPTLLVRLRMMCHRLARVLVLQRPSRRFTADAAADPRDYPIPRPATIEAVERIGPGWRGKFRWVVTANSKKFVVTTNQLFAGPSRGKFGMKLFAATGRLIKISSREWDSELNRLGKAARESENPIETTCDGVSRGTDQRR
jgi:hypothetical protein